MPATAEVLVNVAWGRSFRQRLQQIRNSVGVGGADEPTGADDGAETSSVEAEELAEEEVAVVEAADCLKKQMKC